jgi:hypothetical protein
MIEFGVWSLEAGNLKLEIRDWQAKGGERHVWNWTRTFERSPLTSPATRGMDASRATAAPAMASAIDPPAAPLAASRFATTRAPVVSEVRFQEIKIKLTIRSYKHHTTHRKRR